MPSSNRLVRLWLLVVFVMIGLMTCIGGVTRLTGSGLSMVEWSPIMGVLPPLSASEWQRVYRLYQGSPEFQQLNSHLSLEAFKYIFFWEYLHRLFGRLIGVVVAIPWLVLLLSGQLSRRVAIQTFGLLVVGGLQGLLGWYMVQSGLVDVPHVSHLRLAAHLALAFALAQGVVWVYLSLGPKPLGPKPRAHVPLALRGAVLVMIALSALQVVYGALMAGTHAGWIASTFPSMNGQYLPGPFYAANGLAYSLIYAPAMIHWVHRFLGCVLLALYAGVLWGAWRVGDARIRHIALAAGGLLGLQVLLGVVTVVYGVPIAVAVAHQAGALLLVSCLTVLWYRTSQ